jgi:nucleotide-binding universal stress UspA family protein
MTNRDLIVVGVDGSDGGRRALAWAVDEGIRTGRTVQAVTAWQWDGIEGSPLAATSPALERGRAERISAREIEAVRASTGTQAVVAREVVEGPPVRVLTEAARSAALLALGSHGFSRLHHAVLGSISEECVRQATCPVVVVPVPYTEDARPAAAPVPVS